MFSVNCWCLRSPSGWLRKTARPTLAKGVRSCPSRLPLKEPAHRARTSTICRGMGALPEWPPVLTNLTGAATFGLLRLHSRPIRSVKTMQAAGGVQAMRLWIPELRIARIRAFIRARAGNAQVAVDQLGKDE